MAACTGTEVLNSLKYLYSANDRDLFPKLAAVGVSEVIYFSNKTSNLLDPKQNDVVW